MSAAPEPQLTPMMAQYRRIKGELPKDALLLFRLGDFYEMFFEDAVTGAQLLNVALTKRGAVPMCGIPFHAFNSYVARLLRAGRKVADRIPHVAMHQIDLSTGAVLEKGCVYIVELMEELKLPAGISGKANPKSTTGRLDIFTRLITDNGNEFEGVREGYRGKLYLEVVPRTFSILLQQGARLNQIRFVRGHPPPSDTKLGQLDYAAEIATLRAAKPDAVFFFLPGARGM